MSKQEYAMWGELYNFRKKYLPLDNTDQNRKRMLDEGLEIKMKLPDYLQKMCHDLIWAVLHEFERKEDKDEATN